MLSTPLLALLAPAALAGDPVKVTPLVLEGDVLAGVGAVTRVDNLAINGQRDWIVEVDTDGADLDADSALVKDGSVLLQEGQSLPTPGGAVLDFFDTVNLNDLGESAWNFSIDPFPSGSDTGIYFGDTLVLQEGTFSSAAGLSAGTPYIGFFECKLNDARQVLVMASVDDPAISSSVDRALMLWQLDAAGNLLSETVVAKEGDLLAGQTDAVADFETNPHNFALNDAGSVMFVADLEGDTASDHAVYVDGTLVAQEGSTEPFTGRDWDLLSLAELDLNDAGGWALIGSLAGDTATDGLLRTDSQIIAREGFTLPAISPFVLQRFGNASDTGPVHLSDSGDVLWYGDWSDPDTDRDTGLFLNAELIVQEGVTTVGGLVIDEISGVQDGYSMSDDGRFIVFEGQLSDGRDGAFLVSPAGEVTPFDGCTPNLGTLALAGGTPEVGGSFDLQLGNPQVAGSSLGFVFFSTAPIGTFPPCGIPLAGAGELLVSITPPNPVADFVVSSPTLTVTIPVPNDLQLVGFTLYAQGLFTTAFLPSEPYRLTNGLEICVGDA